MLSTEKQMVRKKKKKSGCSDKREKWNCRKPTVAEINPQPKLANQLSRYTTFLLFWWYLPVLLSFSSYYFLLTKSHSITGLQLCTNYLGTSIDTYLLSHITLEHCGLHVQSQIMPIFVFSGCNFLSMFFT